LNGEFRFTQDNNSLPSKYSGKNFLLLKGGIKRLF
jgi:hypothetical protein